MTNCIYSYFDIYNGTFILDVILLNKMNLEYVPNACLKPVNWYKVILTNLEATAFGCFHFSAPLIR